MKCGQGWLIKNRKTCYLLLINAQGYVGLLSALKTYHGPWYLIEITGLAGTEKEIVNSVNDKNRVSIAAKWKEQKLFSFDIINGNHIVFTGNNATILKETVYNN